MSFIREKPLFGRGGNIYHPVGLLSDAMLILLLFAVRSCWNDLQQFSSDLTVVAVSKFDFGIIGGIGLYGFRLATYVAMIRHNRMPQIIEWYVCLIGLAVACLCFLSTGFLVVSYASARGFEFCYDEGHRSGLYIFTEKSLACPPRTGDSDGHDRL
jgi:hypothetical protein